jgi:holin-like protein
VLGFLALLACLLLGWIPSTWVAHGSAGLLKHLPLYFVPAMLAVVKYKELVSLDGLKLLLATVVGTLLVMTGTALVVELSFRRRMAREL